VARLGRGRDELVELQTSRLSNADPACSSSALIGRDEAGSAGFRESAFSRMIRGGGQAALSNFAVSDTAFATVHNEGLRTATGKRRKGSSSSAEEAPRLIMIWPGAKKEMSYVLFMNLSRSSDMGDRSRSMA
jgi:hypothetical protein